MNKVVASIVLGLAVSASGTAYASNDRDQQLVECKEQLAAMYGEDTRVRLRGKAAGRESILKFSVYPNGNRHLRVSCALAGDGSLAMTDRHGMALMAGEQTEELIAQETDAGATPELAIR